MTKREYIINQIETKFATITTSNGYLTNIGDYLESWIGAIYGNDKTEVSEIRFVGTSFDESELPSFKENLELIIKVAKKGGTTTAAYLTKSISDIERMIGSNLSTFRTDIDASIKFTRGDVDIDIEYADGKIIGEANIIIYVEHIYGEWSLGNAVRDYSLNMITDYNGFYLGDYTDEN